MAKKRKWVNGEPKDLNSNKRANLNDGDDCMIVNDGTGDIKENTRKGSTRILEEVEDELHCVICLETPENDYVYQCDNGHILCSACHTKVTYCPLCRVKLGKSRNLAVEKILSKCQELCKYGEHGCTIKLTKDALKAHMDICKYKPVKCVAWICKKKIPMIELLQHVNDEHDFSKTEQTLRVKHIRVSYINMSQHLNISRAQFSQTLIAFDETNFFSFACRTFEPKRRWNLWLYMINTPEACKDYIYTVKISGVEYNEELSYTGQPVSLLIDKNEIIRSSRCLTVDEDAIQRFCNNDRLTIYFHIRQNVN